MRRDLRTCLAALLAAWMPVDSAFAAWWHHHHRGPVVIVAGPVPMAPCGPPAPWAGWGHAIVIDDRPLVAPAAFVVAAPVVEVVVHPIAPVVVEHARYEEVIVAGDGAADAAVGVCTCDTNDVGIVSDGATPIVADVWTTDAAPTAESTRATVDTERPQVPETRPDAPPPPPAEPLPTDKDPPVAPPVAAEQPGAGSAPSVLEPREPVTLQGETAAPIENTIGETLEEREGFEGPAADGDDVVDDEPMDEGDAMLDDGDDAGEPAAGGARNLFDEAPVDDFGAPAGDDDAIPDAPPMEEGFEPPADEAPLDDMPVDDMPMDDMPMEAADDAGGFESPADDDIPMDDDADAQTEETPADEEPSADPFDSGLRVPAAPTRTWQDDTGRFSTEGRLVEIRAGSVRILKATGRHTTVPMERLSAADRDHVAGVRRAIVASRPGRGDTAAIR